MTLEDNIENIVNEKPSLFRRSLNFVGRKVLPYALATSIAITSTYALIGCSKSKKTPIYPTGPASEFVEPDPSKKVQDPDTGINLVKDQLLVSFNSGVTDTEKQEIINNVNGKTIAINNYFGVHQVEVFVTNLNDLYTKESTLENDGRVKFASPINYLEENKIPDSGKDPLMGTWDESNPAGLNWGLEYIKAPSTWDYTIGNSNVKIGVIDFGFDTNHEDLDDNIAHAEGVNNDLNPDNSHGTIVAGVIGAEGNNDHGITGMNWNTSLHLYRTTSDWPMIAQSIEKAIKDGVKIINISLGSKWSGTGYIPDDSNPRFIKFLEDQTQTFREVFTKLKENGVLLINSAGNDCFDAKWNGVITPTLAAEFPDNYILVAANDDTGNLVVTATWGSNYGDFVTVSAPGIDITSCTIEKDGWYKSSIAGTSVAAPFVTGLAGLLLSMDNNLTPAQIKKIIINGAKIGGKFFTDPKTNDIYIINSLESILQTFWKTETIDSSGFKIGRAHSIAIDINNHPHISYRKEMIDNKGELTYANYDGSNWNVQTIDNTVDDIISGQLTDIALNSNNHPHISYSCDVDSSTTELRHAYFDGSSWLIETIDNVLWRGCGSSIALDSNNNPHISYSDKFAGGVEYAHYDGSSWLIETIDNTGESFGDSLALDSNNRPHISYNDSTNLDLKYAHFNGTSWKIETIDSAGDVGDVSSIASIALDSNNRPHIVYYDNTNTSIKYAHYDGSNWNIKTVDDTLGITSQGFNSIALDSDNKPHISYSYYSTTNGSWDNHKYAHYDGSKWNIEKLLFGDYWDNSMVLDEYDRPHISYGYIDATNNWHLKYTHK